MILSRQFCHKKTVIFTVLLLINGIFSFFPHAIATSSSVNVISQDDGIYSVTTFTDLTVQTLSNCEKSDSGNKLVLETIGSKVEDFNFKDWKQSSPDRMYTGQFLWFSQAFPLFFFTNFFDKELTENTYYNVMSEDDGTVYPPKKNTKSIQQWHHFRFKIGQDFEDSTPFNITWTGKADNFKSVTLYTWRPLISSWGIWRELDRNTTNKTNVKLSYQGANISLNEEGYIHLCVVVVPTISKDSYLQTNFVNVQIQATGYETEGKARFKPIIPEEISRWERFTWSGYEKEDSSISFQFYDEENGEYSLLRQYDGTNRIVDISSFDKDVNLSINVTLEGSISVTPELYEWSVSWQRSDDDWSDDFSSNIRIDESSSNIIVSDSTVHLVSTVNDWPMFGQNPRNTRVSPGFGPGSNINNLCWQSKERVGCNLKNPIIYAGKLYVSNNISTKIYAYDLQNVNEFIHDAESKSTIQSSIDSDLLLIKNSPAMTNKGTIVVATGTTSIGGRIRNELVGLPKNLGDEPEWRFLIEDAGFDNPYICYDASPVVKDNKIYITSWSGDSSLFDEVTDFLNLSKGNNKLICLNDEGGYEWSEELSAASFSSPAVGENIIIAGCEKINGKSLFAYNLQGTQQWSVDVGPIGYASPVISDDTVYVVSKNVSPPYLTAFTQVVAVNINNGNIRWSRTIGDSYPELYRNSGYTSPVVHDGFIYVASPDGLLYKLYTENGTNVQTPLEIYNKGVTSSIVTSSPAFADNRIYIGTPDGYIHAINANSFEMISKQTDPVTPIVSSPIVVDGFVYYIDEDGVLYCRGEKQTSSDNTINGYVLSMPIELPDDLYWNKFYVDDTKPDVDFITYSILRENGNVLIEDIDNNQNVSTKINENIKTIRLKAEFDIDADIEQIVSLDSWKISFTHSPPEPDEETRFRDFEKDLDDPPIFRINVTDADGLVNTSAQFNLEYSNESNGTDTIDWYKANFTADNRSTQGDIIVNMSYIDNVDEIDVYHRIRFKINDTKGNTARSSWYTIEGIPDDEPPLFYLDSFTPDPPYISTMTPSCTIQAKDIGSNGEISGMNVSSAEYIIKYKKEGSTKTHSESALCSGSNGITSRVTITADISDADVAENITTLQSIRFSIKDMEGNTNQTSWIDLKYDGTPPSSSISNTEDIPLRSNASSITVIATGEDTETDDDFVSGIKEIGLFYRKSGTLDWSSFGSSCSQKTCSWDFTVGPDNGGEYELCTRAVDNASNTESFPSQGDVFLTYDPNEPEVSFPNQIIEFNDKNVLPSFNQVTFTDDYELYQMFYRLNSEETDKWTLITTTDDKEITPEWTLTETQWNDMIEDEISYMYFKVVDALGNTLIITSNNNAMQIMKNVEDITNFTLDLNEFDTLQWDNSYTIRVNTQDTTISSMTLWYRFAGETKNTSNNWTKYKESINSTPFEWDFIPEDGNGYYQFYVEVTTAAGLTKTTAIETTYITLFPLVELITALVLTIVLFTISGLVLKKYRQKNKKKKMI